MLHLWPIRVWTNIIGRLNMAYLILDLLWILQFWFWSVSDSSLCVKDHQNKTLLKCIMSPMNLIIVVICFGQIFCYLQFPNFDNVTERKYLFKVDPVFNLSAATYTEQTKHSYSLLFTLKTSFMQRLKWNLLFILFYQY